MNRRDFIKALFVFAALPSFYTKSKKAKNGNDDTTLEIMHDSSYPLLFPFYYEKKKNHKVNLPYISK